MAVIPINIAKNIFVSYSRGRLAFIFMILAIVGIIFQYAVLYSHLIPYFAGDAVTATMVIFGTLALFCGGLAIILAAYRIPKWVWILLSSLIFVSIMLPPSILGGMLRFFPYVIGDAFQLPWIWIIPLPTNPAVDFIGFWMAVGGSLMSMIASIKVPKK